MGSASYLNRLLKRATHRLYHLGPDSQEVCLPPNQRVGLGHARLSIIELQPRPWRSKS